MRQKRRELIVLTVMLFVLTAIILLAQAYLLQENEREVENLSKRILSKLPTTSQHFDNLSLPLECSAVHPNYLFVVRIAKCASTTIIHLLHMLSKTKRFYLLFHRSGAYNFDEEEINEIQQICLNRSSSNSYMVSSGRPKLVYARHFYYTKFPLLSEYTYITFVRHPVDRVISAYLYYHFSDRESIQSLVPSEYKGEDIEVCVQLNHEGCTSNLMTKYFCGHAPYCSSGSKEALTVAKYNMKHKFVFVGLVEEMEVSLRLLSVILPDVFGKMDSSFLPKINKNEHSEQDRNITALSKLIIMQHNKADMELYDFAVTLFESKVQKCLLKEAYNNHKFMV